MQETKTSNLPAVQTLQYIDHNSFSKAILDRVCQDRNNQAVVDSYLVWDIINTLVFYNEVSNGAYLSIWEYTEDIESLSYKCEGTRLEFEKLVMSEYNNLVADIKKEYNDDVRVHVYW